MLEERCSERVQDVSVIPPHEGGDTANVVAECSGGIEKHLNSSREAFAQYLPTARTQPSR